MRIISLNTWGGRGGREKLLGFFKKYADTTDVFCLQEIWSAPYTDLQGVPAGGLAVDNSTIMVYGLQEITEVLPNYSVIFRPHQGDHYGLAMFVHKSIEVKEESELFVYKHKGFIPEGDVGLHARNIQWATVQNDSVGFTTVNFHGLWNGQGKTDTEDRILQSKNILAFLEKLEGEYVVCGDFNLLPDTESIKLFDDAGLRNLIREYGITSTRTSFYTKPEKYADYAFVSKGLNVKTFRVLPDEVSDHAALLIEVE